MWNVSLHYEDSLTHWYCPTDYTLIKIIIIISPRSQSKNDSRHAKCGTELIKISSLLSPPTHIASVNDIRARGELLSRLGCQQSQSSPGLWCPLCSISVWLWDSRLKQTLIIPLVKHADKSAHSSVFFLFQIPLCLFILALEENMCWGAFQLSNWCVLFFFFFFCPTLFRVKLVKRDKR